MWGTLGTPIAGGPTLGHGAGVRRGHRVQAAFKGQCPFPGGAVGIGGFYPIPCIYFWPRFLVHRNSPGPPPRSTPDARWVGLSTGPPAPPPTLWILERSLLGSSFDELELNRLVCNQYGVRIKGVPLWIELWYLTSQHKNIFCNFSIELSKKKLPQDFSPKLRPQNRSQISRLNFCPLFSIVLQLDFFS